jgi:lysozyme family protein
MGVNASIKTAVKLLQHIIEVTEDGIVGPITISKINSNYIDIVERYENARIDYYNHLVEKNPKLKVFIKGWISRVNTTKFEE